MNLIIISFVIGVLLLVFLLFSDIFATVSSQIASDTRISFFIRWFLYLLLINLFLLFLVIYYNYYISTNALIGVVGPKGPPGIPGNTAPPCIVSHCIKNNSLGESKESNGIHNTVGLS